LVARHGAIYLNDLLPEGRTRAQYQQLCLVAAQLEAAGEIESRQYWARYGYPGHKALVKPGHTVEERNVAQLEDNERLTTVVGMLEAAE